MLVACAGRRLVQSRQFAFVVLPQVLHVHNLLQERRHARFHHVVAAAVHRPLHFKAVAVDLVLPVTAHHLMVRQRRDRKRVRALVRRTSATRPILPDRLQLHSLLQALLEPTRRALLPRRNRHRTRGAPQANVILPVLHRPLEEAFAGLARKDPVVEAGDLVAADRTWAVDELLTGNARRGGYARILLVVVVVVLLVRAESEVLLLAVDQRPVKHRVVQRSVELLL